MTEGTIQIMLLGVNMTFFYLKLLLLLRMIFAPMVECSSGRIYAMEAHDHDLISDIVIAETDIRGQPRHLANVVMTQAAFVHPKISTV